MPYIEPRRLSPEERAVLTGAIRSAQTREFPINWVEKVDGLRVYSVCGCGCASIGFCPEQEALKEGAFVLADGMASKEGAPEEWIGVLIYARPSGEIVEMELYSPGDAHALLPHPASIRPWPDHRRRNTERENG